MKKGSSNTATANCYDEWLELLLQYVVYNNDSSRDTTIAIYSCHGYNILGCIDPFGGNL